MGACQPPAQLNSARSCAPDFEVHTKATLLPEESKVGPADANSAFATSTDTGGPAEATAAAARMVAGDLEAALKRASSGSSSIPCAAAAATVLANMALALLHLGHSSTTAAAATVAATAGVLLQHVEQQRKLQHVQINKLFFKTYQRQTPEQHEGHESDQGQPKRKDNLQLVSTNLHKVECES